MIRHARPNLHLGRARPPRGSGAFDREAEGAGSKADRDAAFGGGALDGGGGGGGGAAGNDVGGLLPMAASAAEGTAEQAADDAFGRVAGWRGLSSRMRSSSESSETAKSSAPSASCLPSPSPSRSPLSSAPRALHAVTSGSCRYMSLRVALVACAPPSAARIVGSSPLADAFWGHVCWGHDCQGHGY